ncbi:MAG: phosphatidylglycerophosphatase A [Bacteroidota bacterium]
MGQPKGLAAISIASTLGVGLLPVAPGTWGSLVAIPLLLGLSSLSQSVLVSAVAIVLLCIIGVWAIDHLPASWAHDDGRIVIDEVIGMMITMLLLPMDWKTLLIGFIAFRAFDIAKPLGIRRFDRLESSWSVLLDDIVAGIYANILIRGLFIALGWT